MSASDTNATPSAQLWTPGPWFAHHQAGSRKQFGVVATSSYDPRRGAPRRIAWCGSPSPFKSSQISAEDEANARLIAAAPELYEALRAIRDWDDGDANPAGYGGLRKSLRELAEAALAKAEGRS